MFCGEWPMAAAKQAAIERALDITAGQIQITLASVDACSCAFSAAATNALKLLNCWLAALFHDCPCGGMNLDSDTRQQVFEMAQEMLNALKSGEFEVCEGETGSNFPVFDWAEQSVTVWNAAKIIAKGL